MTASCRGIERLLTNLVYLLAFFSYFKVIASIDADNQPLASVAAVLVILAFPRRESLTAFMLITSVVAIWAFLSVLVRGHGFGGIIVRDLLSILAPLTAYFAAKSRFSYVRPQVLLWVVGVWLLVICIQHFQVLQFLQGPLNTILERVIRDIALEKDNFRGVSGLATEPAMAAINIFCMLLSGWLFYIQKHISKKTFMLLLCAVAIMSVANRSGSLILYLFVLSLALTIFGASFHWLMILMVGAGALVTFDMLSESRLGQIASIIANIDFADLDLTVTSSAIGGFRWTSILISYLTPLFFPISFFGAQQVEFVATASLLGIDFTTLPLHPLEMAADSFKPPAFGAFIALNFGVVGIVALMFWVTRSVLYVWRGADALTNGREIKAILICALFLILGISLVGSLLPWLILAQVEHVVRSANEKSKTFGDHRQLQQPRGIS